MRNLSASLFDLAIPADVETRSICAENPTGARGGGALAVPTGATHPSRRLGKGWKVRPFIPLPSGTTADLAVIDQPGVIRHIWMTVDPRWYRDLIVRIHWDGVAHPAVEVPLGDFFALANGQRYAVNSLPVAVNPLGGLNCYWPMPFASARISIENQGPDIAQFFFQITYDLTAVPAETGRFCAQWRISQTSREHPEHVILDGVQGDGHYVGTAMSWAQMSDGWWGEGEMKFFIDGDTDPTICGTGIEDYFGGAWAFMDTYSTPFLGYPLWQKEPNKIPKHGLYRWHILDPIRFRRDLKVTAQALGWWPDGTFQPLSDEIATVAYWYQRGTPQPFPALPPRHLRFPR